MRIFFFKNVNKQNLIVYKGGYSKNAKVGLGFENQCFFLLPDQERKAISSSLLMQKGRPLATACESRDFYYYSIFHPCWENSLQFLLQKCFDLPFSSQIDYLPNRDIVYLPWSCCPQTGNSLLVIRELFMCHCQVTIESQWLLVQFKVSTE